MATSTAAIDVGAPAVARSWQSVASDYLSLTKPRIIELLLLTTVPAMVLAAGGWPGTTLVAATVIAGALVSGSAHATNMVIDRDIDAAMQRTAHRPLPSGRIGPAAALRFGVGLLAVGSVLMWVAAGWLAAALTVAAWWWYVGIYTLWLKRRTPHNIVIGGVAGAMPPLIGWAAVTGSIAWPAVVLFAIVTLWTPTHFWALAIGTGQDYADAGVPMLPAVRGPRVAARHAAGYALATVGCSLLLAGVGGPVLVGVAGLCGAGLLVIVGRLAVEPTVTRAWRAFHASNAYLALLFVAVGVVGLRGP